MRDAEGGRPDFGEMNLAIFRGQDPGGVLWQPRLEFWYAVNKRRGTLPERYRDAELLDIYDNCLASVRYFVNPLRVRYRRVRLREEWLDERRLARVWETPVGTLREVLRYDEWGVSAYPEEYKLKGPEDFRVLEYILQDEEWWWDQEAYRADLERVGHRGAPQFYFRRSPIQGLFIEHMGLENAIYALHDCPEVVSHYVEVATRADDARHPAQQHVFHAHRAGIGIVDPGIAVGDRGQECPVSMRQEITQSAHIETDECGAPAFFSNGSRLLLAKGPNGKLTPD
ncbi:MAG TPA: hypothetical protein EYP09_00035, partial [Anaerolineae bacterium]|nr:hypothetical protein [Anaerolineae bacterium]